MGKKIFFTGCTVNSINLTPLNGPIVEQKNPAYQQRNFNQTIL